MTPASTTPTDHSTPQPPLSSTAKMHFLAKLAVSLPAIAGVASAAVLPRAVDSDTMISALKDLAQRSSDTGDLAKALGPADQNPTTDNYAVHKTSPKHFPFPQHGLTNE
ncbi:hypothetical protein SLS55_005006 [Diplodia seriata]|uniref:Uncharacterized protein n=1 Tax=Diplodia seriata TaxID=420778 RepID=A0ABR3CPB9_9PEZI